MQTSVLLKDVLLVLFSLTYNPNLSKRYWAIFFVKHYSQLFGYKCSSDDTQCSSDDTQCSSDDTAFESIS